MRCGKEGLHPRGAGRCFPTAHGSEPSTHTHDENCSSVVKHSPQTIRLCYEHAAETDRKTGISASYHPSTEVQFL